MILSCGEALIDMLPRTSTEGEPSFAPYAGGAVFNTAIALGRLGAPVGFFSGLSNDLFGDILRDTLAKSGVESQSAVVSGRPTTLAFVKITNGQASYAFYDENTAGRMLAPADLPQITADALFFGGISLVGEPCGTAYEALMTREAPSRVTMIDPNVRTGFITDAAAYRGRIDRMFGLADIVKVSDEDLAWLSGETDIAKGAATVRAKGAKLVLVTEGAKGATAFWSGDPIRVPAPKVSVVDTVGAGDTFNAGVLASLHKAGVLTKSGIGSLSADVIRAALEMGVKVAAVVVARAGANPPWANEL